MNIKLQIAHGPIIPDIISQLVHPIIYSRPIDNNSSRHASTILKSFPIAFPTESRRMVHFEVLYRKL